MNSQQLHAQQLAFILAAHQARRRIAQLRASTHDADAVSGIAEGGWGGADILGGYGEVGAAGLIDVVGDVSTFAAPQRSMFSQAALANQNFQAVNPSALMDAANLLQRPLGLPPNATMTADALRVARRQYIALGDRQTIAAGAGVTITAFPQSVARIERLIIESIGSATASGRDFIVSRVDVGDMRQISGAGELPGSMFTATGFQLDNKLDTSNPGNQVIITIENVTAGAITVAFGAVGTVVR